MLYQWFDRELQPVTAKNLCLEPLKVSQSFSRRLPPRLHQNRSEIGSAITWFKLECIPKQKFAFFVCFSCLRAIRSPLSHTAYSGQEDFFLIELGPRVFRACRSEKIVELTTRPGKGVPGPARRLGWGSPWHPWSRASVWTFLVIIQAILALFWTVSSEISFMSAFFKLPYLF